MCQFFSFVSDGNGKYFYSDWDARREYRSGKKTGLADSHTSIAHYAGYSGAAEDKLNKYEYNPITKCFRVDQINAKNDQGAAKDFCEALDFSTIVPALRIKPITNPLKLNRKRVTKKDVALLKKWASVWASVWDSVWDSVGASVRDSVRASVWDSVRASVWASVWDSVWDSVGASVGASVWDSVRDSVRASVWDSVRAYTGSFFVLPKWEHIKHRKGQYPFQCVVDLWENGLVPSFDGKVWRLHGGKDATVLWQGEFTNDSG